MDKSKLVHLKNKYPHCYVGATGSSIEVLDGDEIVVSLARNAHGEFYDRQKEMGARDAFCLAPIPKSARAFKLNKDGSVGKDEKYEERKPIAKALAKEFGKIPSIEELKKIEAKEGVRLIDGDDLHQDAKDSLLKQSPQE